jgi:hydroxymethylpyrimidine kinase/phosphomethylpyrimidine kinase
MKVALTIAGSDTCGGAGVQMDLKVFQACGVYGVSALTALTAQNTQGVRRVHHPPPRFVAEQIDAVCRDLSVAAAKTGMLGRPQVVEVVAERVGRREIPNLVVDPVIAAKDGTLLLPGRALGILKEKLLPRARVVTPNALEAALLAGMEVANRDAAREACRRIAGLGVEAVVVKGGHLPGDPVDTLFWHGEFYEFGGERLRPRERPMHGTGCTYSAALAAHLARGRSLPEACQAARSMVETAIRGALALGKGSLLAGPLPAREGECDA